MRTRWRRGFAAAAAVIAVAGVGGWTSVHNAGATAFTNAITRPVTQAQALSVPRTYQASIVRTAYGVPHVTAESYTSLGYGFGYAFASDDICTMADAYVTVEGQRSRYFGPNATYDFVGNRVDNLDSDLYWRSVIDAHTVEKQLAVRTGPSAVLPQVRQLVTGYVAGYNRYLASVGGSAGVPDSACRGKPWVTPITLDDAYLRFYQLVDLLSSADPAATTAAQPPSSPPAARSATMLPTAAQIRAFAAAFGGGAEAAGSNAVAIGSAGVRDHGAGILLGNPHFPWNGPERFYQVQMTIPGVLNVEGATLYGVPVVLIGFNSSVAWSHTVTPSLPVTLYQLTLVPGRPTEYVYDGRPQAMTRRTVTVTERGPGGALTRVSRTLWSTRWGPVLQEFQGLPLPWTGDSAFALGDAQSENTRFLNDAFTTDQATSTAGVLAGLGRYEGMPWVDTVAADSTGHALYSDVGDFPHVTDAEAAACDTALGAATFAQAGLPVLDGSRSSCAWGTDPDSAVPGIFGPAEQPSLTRADYVENSNESFWLTNASAPITGYPRVLGDTDTARSLRTRSALSMITGRISGADGLGPAGFTLRDMENLMFSDIQYGASLVRAQLVAMCRALPGGLAPTHTGTTIAVGDSCDVLAAWDGRENPGSRGAALFRDFWENALDHLREGPWATPFNAADPVSTPSGLNVSDSGVKTAFGDALADLTAAHIPFDAPLRSVQYVVRDGRRIPIPGGPGDPDGEFNAIYQINALQEPGQDPESGSSYIQAVTWAPGNPCPVADTLLTYSESANAASPHYADQTELFAHRRMAPADFCAAKVAADAVSTTVIRGN